MKKALIDITSSAALLLAPTMALADSGKPEQGDLHRTGMAGPASVAQAQEEGGVGVAEGALIGVGVAGATAAIIVCGAFSNCGTGGGGSGSSTASTSTSTSTATSTSQ